MFQICYESSIIIFYYKHEMISRLCRFQDISRLCLDFLRIVYVMFTLIFFM